MNIAIFELRSVGIGYAVANEVSLCGARLLDASPVDAHRFLIICEGSVEVLQKALHAVKKLAVENQNQTNSPSEDEAHTNSGGLIDHEIIASPHASLVPGLHALLAAPLEETLVVVETATLSGLLRVAQVMLVDHKLGLLEIRQGRAHKGRGLAFFTGKRGDSQQAVAAGNALLKSSQRDGRISLIEHPTAEFREFLSYT